MRMLIGASTFLCLGAGAVLAQQTVYQETWRIHVELARPLPPGFHDFRPVPTEVRDRRFKSEGTVLCHAWENAISFAQRVKDGLSTDAALQQISTAWGGSVRCGYVAGLYLAPVRFAIRGDALGRKVALVEWVDQYRQLHYTGLPKAD